MEQEESKALENETKAGIATEDDGPLGAEEQPKAKTFTEDEVNDIVRKRLEKHSKSLYRKLGIEGEEGIEGLVSKAKGFDETSAKLAETEKTLAYVNKGIDQARYGDVEAYFKGKGIEFSEDALAKELETHPEWAKKGEVTQIIQNLGGGDGKKQEFDESAYASKLFGLKHGFVKK